MLPLLLTVGQGLAWFAVTMSQLVIWGAGIGLGFWAIKKVTFIADVKLAGWLAKKKMSHLTQPADSLV